MSAPLFGLVATVAIAVAVVGAVAFARQRSRTAMAGDLHELRQSLTAARLMIDLMVAFAETPGEGLIAAADELARSYAVLAEFERRFYERGWSGLGRLRASTRRLHGRGLFDAHEEVQRLARIWGETARALGRDFEFRWEGGGVQLRGARRHLTEALANLLANAIRHGEGAVTMTARPRGESLRVEVGDEGRGLERPIASIVAARGRIGRRLGPHGHGLAIAVRAAARLGGGITSAPSASGALFVLELPVAIAADDYEQYLSAGDLTDGETSRGVGAEAPSPRPVGVTGWDEM